MLIVDQLKRRDPHLQLISLGVLAGMFTLIAGLWYHQVIAASGYRADLEDQTLRSVRVRAIRGKILDRNGNPLADNRPSYNLNVYLEDLRRNFRYEYTNSVRKEFYRENPGKRLTRSAADLLQREARYRVVSNILYQVSSRIDQPRILMEEDFHRRYLNERTLPLLLLKDLPFPQVARYLETCSTLPSVALDVEPTRYYPYGSAAAHLLGYVRLDKASTEDETFAFTYPLVDFKGVKGLELALDEQLRGRPGMKMVLVNHLAYRQSEEVWQTPEPGTNVVLTIDIEIQRATERALATVRPDVRGAAVVMDCNNGDILAIASAPTYDPNTFVDGLTPEEWKSLNDEELRPLFNRAVYGAYPPGSTFKIVSGLAALEAGVLNPNQIYRSKGFFQIGSRGRHWKDTAGAGDFDFRTAFAFSSNPYFQEYGLLAGPQKVVELAKRFGLGEPTGLVTRQEASGYLPDHTRLRKRDGNRWMDGDTANLCIGQGEITVTPLQMAVLTSAVANNGKVLIPRLIKELHPLDAPDAAHALPAGQVRKEVNSRPDHLALIRRAMLDDVEYRDRSGRRASGHLAAVKGMQVCGKTGTAQIRSGGKDYVTWFVSFAPYSNPKYAVVVVVEEGASGGGTCAPVARQIYEALQKRDNAPKRNPQEASINSTPESLSRPADLHRLRAIESANISHLLLHRHANLVGVSHGRDTARPYLDVEFRIFDVSSSDVHAWDREHRLQSVSFTAFIRQPFQIT